MSKELIEQLTNYLNMLPSHARERQGAVLLERCRDELAKQAERVKALEGLVHECPKCGESCKECACHRTEVRELVEVLQKIRDLDLLSDCECGDLELHETPNLCPRCQVENKIVELLAKHESEGA